MTTSMKSIDVITKEVFNPSVTEEVLKECQLCHKLLPKDQFYDRKDRNGEYTWKTSYCPKCDTIKKKESRNNNNDHYKKYNKEYLSHYYPENKDKYKIYYKKYYYKKLTPEKKILYKQKLKDKYPDIVDQICE